MKAAERAVEFLSANRKALRFLSLFALIFAACYFLFGIAPGVRINVIKPYTEFLARAVTAIINLFGEGAVTEGTLVRSPRFSINIAMGCDGVEASSLFLAGVLAFPTTLASEAHRSGLRHSFDSRDQPGAARGALLRGRIYAVRHRRSSCLCCPNHRHPPFNSPPLLLA